MGGYWLNRSLSENEKILKGEEVALNQARSESQRPNDKELIHLSRKALGLPDSLSMEWEPLEGRGSDRTFYRLKWNQKGSAILIHYDPNRVENTLYAGIASFLSRMNIPVPKVIHHHPNLCLLIVEDLGDVSLWSLRKTSWDCIRALYQKTLQVAYRLHSISEKEFPSEEVQLMEGFGPRLYRWEQEYFKENFLRNLCHLHLDPSLERALDRELIALQERLSKGRKNLIHRDLQSQNVMVREGQVFLIDFQGMRFGNPFYDLGSLLCDPYMDFSAVQREELLSYYYELGPKDLDWSAFKTGFWEASAQRLMQALGAYGFLGLKKGLTSYLNHIPQGLKNLQLATSQVSTLPALRELSTHIISSFQSKQNFNEKI